MIIRYAAKFQILVVVPLLAFVLAVTSTCSIGSNQFSRPEDWELVWSDEFDSGSKPEYPNPDNWGYEIGYVRNREWQYYTDELQNAFCKDGFLNIQAYENPSGTYPTGKFAGQTGSISSASLISQGLVEYQYGWLEIRARIDTRFGSWPAFWTMGAKGPFPDRGECDILEYFRGKLMFNTYWGVSDVPGSPPRGDRSSIKIENLYSGWVNDFHIWAMMWTPAEIRLYMDGQLFNTWQTSRDSSEKSLEGFQQPHYMIINQAIGGIAGGDASDLAYPTSYVVDWVRWYEYK